MGRKLGAPPPFGGEGWVPSNTVAGDEAYTSVPSTILIHPAVWPQGTWDEKQFFGVGVGSPSKTKSPGSSLPGYQVTS